MDCNNELLDKYPFPNDQIIAKIEQIDVCFIKNEEIEEDYQVEPGVKVSFKVNKISVNEQLYKNEETENSSSSKV